MIPWPFFRFSILIEAGSFSSSFQPLKPNPTYGSVHFPEWPSHQFSAWDWGIGTCFGYLEETIGFFLWINETSHCQMNMSACPFFFLFGNFGFPNFDFFHTYEFQSESRRERFLSKIASNLSGESKSCAIPKSKRKNHSLSLKEDSNDSAYSIDFHRHFHAYRNSFVMESSLSGMTCKRISRLFPTGRNCADSFRMFSTIHELLPKVFNHNSPGFLIWKQWLCLRATEYFRFKSAGFQSGDFSNITSFW